jgi:ABC-type sugar transport system ATPase subunit
MARVEYVRIAKSFGSVRVMDDINLTVEDRRFVVLLGPPAAARPPCSG